jgi:hypothetical protein
VVDFGANIELNLDVTAGLLIIKLSSGVIDCMQYLRLTIRNICIRKGKSCLFTMVRKRKGTERSKVSGLCEVAG